MASFQRCENRFKSQCWQKTFSTGPCLWQLWASQKAEDKYNVGNVESTTANVFKKSISLGDWNQSSREFEIDRLYGLKLISYEN